MIRRDPAKCIDAIGTWVRRKLCATARFASIDGELVNRGSSLASTVGLILGPGEHTLCVNTK